MTDEVSIPKHIYSGKTINYQGDPLCFRCHKRPGFWYKLRDDEKGYELICDECERPDSGFTAVAVVAESDDPKKPCKGDSEVLVHCKDCPYHIEREEWHPEVRAYETYYECGFPNQHVKVITI